MAAGGHWRSSPSTGDSGGAGTHLRTRPQISLATLGGHRHQGSFSGHQRSDHGGQALDQIEDLLRRLGRSTLDAGCVLDAQGALRLVFPTPTWEDYLTLAFDEIRQYGGSSVQVMRRLRSALMGLADSP